MKIYLICLTLTAHLIAAHLQKLTHKAKSSSPNPQTKSNDQYSTFNETLIDLNLLKNNLKSIIQPI